MPHFEVPLCADKARWCLRGYLDPDTIKLVSTGKTSSHTISQIGRILALQMIASHGFDLQIGDVKGAFLEATDEEREGGPIFAELPPGGIPNVPPDALILVSGNIYGKNDAPQLWYETWDQEARAAGFIRSRFDKCLYYMRDGESHSLQGILGIHVDDTLSGGKGTRFEVAIARLRNLLPFRKWSIGSGEFCGSFYTQDPVSKTITQSQKSFALEKIAAHQDLPNPQIGT